MINKTNRNDVIKIVGHPHTKSISDEIHGFILKEFFKRKIS